MPDLPEQLLGAATEPADSEDNEVIANMKSLTRDGKTSMTTLYCHCGVRKPTKEALEDHKKRNHTLNF